MTTAPTAITTSIEDDRQRLEEKLLTALSVPSPAIMEQLQALIKAGGKRLRPILTLYASRLYNADPEQALSVAAGIELLHTATLVHDDLVDDAKARRGVSTLNAHFPMGLVILSGDLLFAEAARLVAEADHVGVVRAFARALSEICNGEILQAQSKHTLVTLDDYYERIYGKTGALFRTAAETGAMLGTDDPGQIEALSEYGRLLGMAFQIVDDTLDFTSTAQKAGKPIGHDLRSGVITLPVLLYQAHHRDHLNGTFKRVINGRADDAQVEATIEAIRASGAVEQALDIARDFSAQARAMLDIIPSAPEKQTLLALTEFTVNRDH